MRIGITGATGFIGARVAAHCRDKGHRTVGFSRRPGEDGRSFGLDTASDLSGFDGIVNLAGEPILGLWTAQKRRRIRESRVLGTRRIVDSIEALSERPSVLVNASAVGFYADTGENLVDESSPGGSGFLADVCREWEAEAKRAESFGVRTVFVRIGLVLGSGGALKLIAPVFKLGLGGRLGGGRQWMSAIHIDDVVGIIVWALENAAVRGPVNAVMPAPFRNADFTRELARCVRRPALLPVPALALRLALGDLSLSMLASCRVRPRVAMEGGYQYRFSTLPAALENALR
jgi:uncharacterized protein (TIGR01777 family)